MRSAPQPQELRAVEPMLSGYGKWQRCDRAAGGQIVCGSPTTPSEPVSIAPTECERLMRNGQDAVRFLESVPQCTDAAVAMLEGLARARREPALWSDVSGAYYVRAQRNDEPEDLVRALDAAGKAIERAPKKAGAHFNRALALEALGLSEDAMREWDGLRRQLPPQWAVEATEHWQRLTRQKARSAAVQWPLNEQRLPIAAAAGDHAAVTALIAPYHGAAVRYVEEKVLPAWASAVSQGRSGEAHTQLALAKMIAEAFAALSGDHYLLQSVEQIRTADASARAAIEEGCLAIARARQSERDHLSRRAGDEYLRAEDAFRRAGNPLRFSAALGRATAMLFAKDSAGAQRLYRQLEQETRRRGYPYLLARVHANRGFLNLIEARLLDALAEYGRAQVLFERANDDENLSNVYTRKVGILRRIGHAPSTWREIYQAQRRMSAMLEPQSRHLLIGESALSAVELGYPSVGLAYQETAVVLIRDELARNTDETLVVHLRRNLGVALRGRAAIRVRVGDHAGARTDLEQAIPLMGSGVDPGDEAIVSGFRARIAEVQAQELATTDRKKAIAALNEAIAYASTTHYRSFVASLLLQRGGALFPGTEPPCRTRRPRSRRCLAAGRTARCRPR